MCALNSALPPTSSTQLCVPPSAALNYVCPLPPGVAELPRLLHINLDGNSLTGLPLQVQSAVPYWVYVRIVRVYYCKHVNVCLCVCKCVCKCVRVLFCVKACMRMRMRTQLQLCLLCSKWHGCFSLAACQCALSVLDMHLACECPYCIQTLPLTLHHAMLVLFAACLCALSVLDTHLACVSPYGL